MSFFTKFGELPKIFTTNRRSYGISFFLSLEKCTPTQYQHVKDLLDSVSKRENGYVYTTLEIKNTGDRGSQISMKVENLEDIKTILEKKIESHKNEN